jgi:hypothetical protein
MSRSIHWGWEEGRSEKLCYHVVRPPLAAHSTYHGQLRRGRYWSTTVSCSGDCVARMSASAAGIRGLGIVHTILTMVRGEHVVRGAKMEVNGRRSLGETLCRFGADIASHLMSPFPCIYRATYQSYLSVRCQRFTGSSTMHLHVLSLLFCMPPLMECGPCGMGRPPNRPSLY